MRNMIRCEHCECWSPTDLGYCRWCKPRPAPVQLDGCTCGGIGDTGSHFAGCAWAAR